MNADQVNALFKENAHLSPERIGEIAATLEREDADDFHMLPLIVPCQCYTPGDGNPCVCLHLEKLARYVGSQRLLGGAFKQVDIFTDRQRDHIASKIPVSVPEDEPVFRNRDELNTRRQHWDDGLLCRWWLFTMQKLDPLNPLGGAG